MWNVKTAKTLDSYESSVKYVLDDIIDSQETAVLNSLGSDSLAALLSIGAGVDFSAIIPLSTLTLESAPLEEVIRHIYFKAVEESVQSGVGMPVSVQLASSSNNKNIDTVTAFNKTTHEEVLSVLAATAALRDDNGNAISTSAKLAIAASAIKAIFNKLRVERSPTIINTTVFSAHNSGTYDAGQVLATKDTSLKKTWVSLKDERVRSSHRRLHGKSIHALSSFEVDGVSIKFPRDPSAPADMTINCRCVLKFTR